MGSLATEVAGPSQRPARSPEGVATVLSPGFQTTVQELGGRSGYWHVGVPPSGAWDDLSFALANLAVGNDERAAGLEAVVLGPTLRFERSALVCLVGAADAALLDGRPVQPGVVTVVPSGGVLAMGPCDGPGMRSYLAVAGGIAVAPALGSRATFLLGGLGGMDGRALVPGDVLPLGSTENVNAPIDVHLLLPALTSDWEIRVLAGPHGAPEHLTEAGVHAFFGATWTVDHRADRTGIRLVGPRPEWVRSDGGEAGLHPSNIHDSAYPVGGIMLSGDTPVIVGPDGPSLGGFVVPCAVITADQWKLGQLRPGDTVRLMAVRAEVAREALLARRALLTDPRSALARAFDGATVIATATAAVIAAPVAAPERRVERQAPLVEVEEKGHRPAVTVRAAGDCHVLVEAGPPVLDLAVRLWIHLLGDALRERELAGVTEIVEGVRSLLVKADTRILELAALAAELEQLALLVPDPVDVTLDVREVTLPLALDHPLAHEAMERYARSVRPDAPWCPDNVEFIRRINDLAVRGDVFDIVTAATYLVVGLGDVYLGAPVAVPIDPRHRLVTTKYDPARTWTPQNAVGIGGVYLCIYGMEGPGGYQLVGRTVPVWRYLGEPSGAGQRPEDPWLLRPFDRLRFVPVTADELARRRADIAAGRADLQSRPATFSLAEVTALEREHAEEIRTFRARRQAAFDAERERWRS